MGWEGAFQYPSAASHVISHHTGREEAGASEYTVPVTCCCRHGRRAGGGGQAPPPQEASLCPSSAHPQLRIRICAVRAAPVGSKHPQHHPDALTGQDPAMTARAGCWLQAGAGPTQVARHD